MEKIFKVEWCYYELDHNVEVKVKGNGKYIDIYIRWEGDEEWIEADSIKRTRDFNITNYCKADAEVFVMNYGCILPQPKLTQQATQ